ncbi:uncharacterized protein LOC134812503 isoform X2 [Bolinopsis microptera]
MNDNNGILKDMNLENAVNSDGPFTFRWASDGSPAERQGIYKVILYAKTADASIAGWKVYVEDTSAQKSDAQFNNLDEQVPCTAGDPLSEGKDTKEFICQERLAATQVIIKGSSVVAELAEVVVVGKTWATYPCGLGYYNTDSGTHSDTALYGCKVCEDGSHDARTDFASDPELAKACTQCDNSVKKIFYTKTLDHKKLNKCQSCAAPTVVLADKGTCVKCPAGQEYYAEGADADCNYPANPERASATAVAVTDPSTCTKVECKACPDGTRNPAESSDYCYSCTHMKEYTTDKIECLTCDVGKIRDSTGNTCEDCPAGKKRGISDNNCVPCDSGWMSAAGASVCTECPVGQYEDSKTSCEKCPVGKYNDQTGQSGESSCEVCAEGYVAASEGSETCTQCQQGTYEDGKDKACKNCAAGYYQAAAGLQSCESCGDGEISAEGATTCTQCDKGEEPNSDNTACVPCAAGKYQPEQRKETCLLCGVGTITATTGRDTCDPCEQGQEADVARTACVDCGAGKFQSSADGGACQDCEAGTYSAVKSSECTECSPGYYQENPGQGSCVECPSGKFSGAEGATECSECVAGHVTITEGLSVCTECPVGQYEDSKTSCEKCPAGKYNDQTGQSGESSCKVCAPGYVAASEGSETCTQCQQGTYAADKTQACKVCEIGKVQAYSGAVSCDVCPAGEVPNKGKLKTECVKCNAGQEYYAEGADADCNYPANPERASATAVAVIDPSKCTKVECKACPVGTRNPAESSNYCYSCTHMKEYTTDNRECLTCDVGKIRDSTGNTCEDCPAGEKRGISDNDCIPCDSGWMSAAGASVCTECPVGTKSNTALTDCDLCVRGKYQDKAGQNTCEVCEDGYVTTEDGSPQCVACPQGTKSNAGLTDCDPCATGTYQDEIGKTECKQCRENMFTDKVGQVVCLNCPDKTYAGKDAAKCEPCPPGSPAAVRARMENDGIEEILIEKCISDLGEGCASETEFQTQYGTFSHDWLELDSSSEPQKCEFDEFTAVFTCKMDSAKKTYVEKTYYCQKTANTIAIESLVDDQNVSNEDKTAQMEKMTNNTVMNGIGDVKAVSDVLESIVKSDEGEKEGGNISEAVTQSVLNTVSNLVKSDFKTADDDTETQSASSITDGLVTQIVNVAKQTVVKNKIIKSPRIAVIDLKKGGGESNPSNNGVVTFTLPKANRDGKDLQGCELGSGSSDNKEEKENTILLIETKSGETNEDVDMAVVLITDSTLMPDTTISLVTKEEGEEDEETVTKILDDLKSELEDAANKDGGDAKKSFVNSFITEVKVENAPDNFKLNLFMKPTIDIGNTNSSLNTEPDGKRMQVSYICAKYDPVKAKWEEGCETIYNSAKPSDGVLCLCSHNTSFAVLMSAYEIDRGFAEVQSYLTYVLLGISTVGLILTLVFLLPAKALRSTRSAKINICFTGALLLASLMFLIQDAFISADDTGLIKLKSTGCAVYAMIQHYLWLVVFAWMVVEGFLMYLSLVQVFGSHISKYMLKFNLAAWGIPLPIPFIGYFVFTKQHTVGSFTFTEHGYLADTMCFIRPESISFYALFLAPIVLVILVNLVFFALVAKVIKNSKSSGNISDQEQILRQLKAAVGVMVLLGTGWFFGIFMSIPAPQFQVGMQYLFILLNSSQGIFVFLFYIVLNDQVKSHWLVKVGLQEEKRTTTSSSAAAAGKSAATKATTVSASAAPNQTDNIYENAAASNEDHTYASAEYATASDKTGKHEFPAKSDNNANI